LGVVPGVVAMTDAGSFPGVVHTCRVSTVYSTASVIHAGLHRRHPTATPVSDLRDAGFDVVAVGIQPSAVGGCSFDDPAGGICFFAGRSDPISQYKQLGKGISARPNTNEL